MDRQRLNVVPGFMMFLDLVTPVSADFSDYIGVINQRAEHQSSLPRDRAARRINGACGDPHFERTMQSY